uniref:Uncharacterized protein n=1 Tax=Panagrellus redivivus TaxID=6233 RepID=A0A7E4ZQH7_PANRE
MCRHDIASLFAHRARGTLFLSAFKAGEHFAHDELLFPPDFDPSSVQLPLVRRCSPFPRSSPLIVFSYH